jgi:hypothetical protein
MRTKLAYPGDGNDGDSVTNEAGAESKGTGDVVDVGVVAEDELAENRQAIRGVEGDGAEREDGVDHDGRGEVKETEADWKERRGQ